MLAVTRAKGVTVNGTVWHAFTRDAARRSFDAFSSDKRVLRERGRQSAVAVGSGATGHDSDSPWASDRSASLLWNGLASIHDGLVDPAWPYPPFRGGGVKEKVMAAAVRDFQRESWLS